MRRAMMIAFVLVATSCGPSDVNDSSVSLEANRLAWDLHGNWSLAVGGTCPGGEGGLQVNSTLAWKDIRTQTAGATGSGSWNCGAEWGAFSIDVTTAGVVGLTLYRNGQPASAAWNGPGTYTPKSMAGRFDGADLPWSAWHQ